MLELNPKNRPSIDKILEHPYFTQSPKSSLIINPFTSPLGTPERNDTFSTHAFFSEPVFGADSAPSFGNIVNDDSPKRMDILNAGMFGCKTDYYRKSKSLLNDGDCMYMDSRYEESPLNKLVSKSRDTKESCFGGFNVNEIETIRESNNKRKVILCDDEITNSETAYNQDFFNDKVKSNQDELPCFGGLTPEGSQSISNYNKDKGNNQKFTSPFEEAYQPINTNNIKVSSHSKHKAEHISISERYQKKDSKNIFSKSSDLGSFGEHKFNPTLNQKPIQEKSKMKKPSVLDDDELLFAVAQDSPK